MTASKASEGTASLDKALDVLDAVGSAPQGVSQADLAQRLDLPRTTMYRLLGTLVERGLLRRDPQRRVYSIGLRCFEYARRAAASPDLAAAANPELRALRDLTGETAYLAVLDGLEVLSVDRYDGAHSQRSQAALGQRKPLHCTSQGKAILSALDAEVRDALIKEMSLNVLTPHTITDRRRLQAELRLTAARGWSIDDEEIALGVRCCGAAVVDSTGQVRGAISVAAPAFRMTLARIESLGPEVAQAARRIGASIPVATPVDAAGPVRAVEGDWAFHGAHPHWSLAEQCLDWVDTLAPTVHRATGKADRCIASLEQPIQNFVLLPDGSRLLQLQNAWHELQPDGSLRPSARLPRRALEACTAGPDGQVWACLPDGERWRVGPLQADGSLPGGWTLTQRVSTLAWSPAGDALYAIERDSGSIIVMHPGTAAVRRFANIPKGSGRPAALAIDHQGGVWAALRDGWSVMRHAPDGSIDRVIGLPVPYPTGLALGGPEARQLYVTSDRESLALDTLGHAALSGRLFVIDLNGPPSEA